MNIFKNIFRLRQRLTLSDKLWQIIDELPVIIPVALAGFSVVAMVFLVCNNLDGRIVWPLGIITATVLSYVTHRFYPKTRLDKESKIVLGVLFSGVIVWVSFNVLLSSQHVHTNRDPAVYAVSALRLTDEKDLVIPRSDIFKGISGITQTSAGFDISTAYENTLFAQGAHLLPTLLGLVGQATSESFMLRINPVFGGIAILAVFAFARLLMRPRWALLASIAFSVSMPLIYFSRDTYTEPLTSIFVFSALALLTIANRSNLSIFWFLAGLVAGTIALTRIDAPLSIVGILFGGLIYLMLANRGQRLASVRHFALLLFPIGLLCLLGWLDVSQLASGYYKTLQPKIAAQYMLMLAVLILGVIFILLAWKTTVLKTLHQKTKSWRGRWAVVLVVTGSALLAFRPLWLIGHRETPIGVTEGLQRAAGMAVDPYRDYSEQTINWMIWYIGPVLVALSVIGFAIAAYKALHSRSIVWITSMAVIFATALLYFNKPSITPDQIWAARRFLPVVIPGIAIFGALGLAWLYEKKSKLLGVGTKTLVPILATLAITFPLMVSYPLIFLRTFESQLSQVRDICSVTSEERTVILWAGVAGRNLVQPLYEVCGVDSFAIETTMKGSKIDKEFLRTVAGVAGAKGYNTLLGIYGNQTTELLSSDQTNSMTTVSAIRFLDYEHTLVRPPVAVEKNDRIIQLGRIGLDGALTRMDQ